MPAGLPVFTLLRLIGIRTMIGIAGLQIFMKLIIRLHRIILLNILDIRLIFIRPHFQRRLCLCIIHMSILSSHTRHTKHLLFTLHSLLLHHQSFQTILILLGFLYNIHFLSGFKMMPRLTMRTTEKLRIILPIKDISAIFTDTTQRFICTNRLR